MGSSAKKKKEKKKDFQKAKLKVGKAKPKAENQTDTAFRSKAIVLNQQSLNVAAPTSTSLFSHHISMLSSRSDSQRKESLAYLTTFIATHPVNQSLPQPVGSLLTKTCPLILDGSLVVRQQLLKFFQVLPLEEICDHVVQILPFVRAGMTHLSRDIRGSAIDVLAWLLRDAGNEIVSCTGGWQKTLESFTTLLGWRIMEDPGKWSTSKASFSNESKTIARIMQVFDQFLRAGLEVAKSDENLEEKLMRSSFPVWHTRFNQVAIKSNAYAHLNLYGSRTTDDALLLEDREDRLAIFDDRFRTSVSTGIEAAKQEGGEPGRAAGLLLKTLKQTYSAD